MALTAHKTVTMFMRYVHTDDDPIRAAADAVAQRRLTLIGGAPAVPAPTLIPEPIIAPPTIAPKPADALTQAADQKPLGLVDGKYSSRTKLGNLQAVPPS
ncbi:hypothetical protein NKJ95_31070 [Mesorhizobium sp. M0012]